MPPQSLEPLPSGAHPWYRSKGAIRETGFPPSMATASSPARVLVVEEQVQSRSSIDCMLEKPEYSTVLSGGSEAIAHIERDPPFDLVLSDLVMAGFGGNGLIERIARYNRIPLWCWCRAGR